ncbi:MAG: hypothetical protein ABI237_01595 [Ginsengibacter sp.]
MNKIVRLQGFLNFSVSSEIIMYPIPPNRVIYIANKDKTLLRGLFSFCSASGKEVMQTYSNPVNIHSLILGLYYIKVADEKGKLIGTQVIIKQ